ncbi:DRC3 [Symbiodinium sp. KB8]|nr:DRC3 [Symbiodinium sp. KB8]
MANPIALALSGKASSSVVRNSTTEFLTQAEFASTLQVRFPTPQPITMEMITESIAFEEMLEHTDEMVDYSTHVPTLPEEVTSLRLSFRRIPALANLEGLPKLRELRLDNNDIPEIQNLTELTTLTWLGEGPALRARHVAKRARRAIREADPTHLSFNRIEKIQGLETLAKLTDLALYGNRISELSGLGGCPELQVLSLGRNRISSLSTVKTLRQCSALRALSLDANPCSEEDEYRSYVIAFVPQLTYLDYTAITDRERDGVSRAGVSLEELKAADEADALAGEARQAKEAAIAKTAHLREMHIEAAATALDEILAADPAWQELQKLDSLHDPYALIIDVALDLGEKFRTGGSFRHKQIAREIEHFNAAVAAVLASSEAEAAKQVASLAGKIKHLTHAMRAKPPRPPSEADFQALLDEADAMEVSLTQVELMASEQVYGMIDTLDTELSSLKALKLAEHDKFFRSLSIALKSFLDDVAAAGKAVYEAFIIDGDWPAGIDEESDVGLALRSKDSAEAMLKEGADAMEAHLIQMDDDARKRVNSQCNDAVELARADERERNRVRLGEIAALREAAHLRVEAWTEELAMRNKPRRHGAAISMRKDPVASALRHFDAAI